jgi:hypothetical protein
MSIRNDTQEDQVEGSRLLAAVEAVAISPAEAKAFVRKLDDQHRRRRPADDDDARLRAIAKRIVDRYAKLAGGVGGATALSGVIPGIGTAVAAAGGAFADATASMKLQVDMCMCLAELFGYDLHTEDGRHLAFIIAAGGAAEKAGVGAACRLASKAGVRLVREYLKGATLQAIKEFFKKLGIIFTRKALEKAIPFGVGVVIGSGANYGLTRYVGGVAIDWFFLAREEP